jgi:hypothetical protein
MSEIKLKTAYTGLLLVLLSTLIVVLLWSFNKGFDFRDEGLFYAYSQPETENFSAIINYDLFFKLFFQTTGIKFGIIGLRVLNFSLYLFMGGVAGYLLKKRGFTANSILFAIFGLLCIYAFSSKTVNYYSLTLFFVFLFWVLLEKIFTLTNKYKIFLSLILSGVISSLSFMVKPPVGLTLLLISFLIPFFILKIRYYVFYFLLIIIGFSLVQIFFNSIFSHYSFLGVINNSFELSDSYSSYGKGVLVKRVFSGMRWSVLILLSGLLISLSIKKRDNKLISLLFILLSALIIFYFFSAHIKSNEFSFLQYSLIFFTSLFIGFSFSIKNYSLLNKKMWFIYGFLFVSPFICILGSNVYFYRLGQGFIFFWWILILYINKDIFRFISYNYLICLFFISLISYQVLDNQIISPFNQPPLSNNFVHYEYKLDKKIYLDDSQVSYLQNLKTVLEPYKIQNFNVLGLFAFPGDILLTGNMIKYNPWIWDEYQYKYFFKKMRADKKDINSVYIMDSKELQLYIDINITDSIKKNNSFVYIGMEKK